MKSSLGLAFRRVRWRIFGFIFCFGFLSYIQQKSVTIAAAQMMPQLGLSQMQVGWMQQAFVLGYAVLQLPGSLFGQRYGARRTLVTSGLISLLAMIAIPLAPQVGAGQTLLIELIGAQLALGLAQAAIMPVGAGVLQSWFPAQRWAFVIGIGTMNSQLGAAITPPLIANLMSVVGWQSALLWLSVPALLITAGWAWYGRNTPREHPSVTRVELCEIGENGPGPASADICPKALLSLLKNRNVLLLSISYMLMNYVFYLLGNWCFLYLIQARHFSVLESGWLAVAPPLVSAVGAGAGGIATGALCKRYGYRWGFRLTPLIALPAAGLLLMVGVRIANPYLAVLAFSLCFGFVELTEASFWSSAMSMGRANTMIVCGVMNTGGNLGGIIGIPIVAYLSGQGSWSEAFLTGTGFAIASAIAWLAIDASEAIHAEPSGSAIAGNAITPTMQVPNPTPFAER